MVSVDGCSIRLHGTGRWQTGSFGDAREVELEGSAWPGFAVNPDIAAELLNHAIHGGQPQARAFALFLGGEKRLEEAPARLGIHAIGRCR